MNHPDFVRSVDIEADGRTLIGRAFRWEHPSRVADPGKPAYLEEFARTSADRTLQQRPSLPLLRDHDLKMLLGQVDFERSAEGLMFVARLSKVPEADHALELVNDGPLRSVSVRFRAYQSAFRSSRDGRVTVRKEIGLRELSLVPTGFGAHEDAEVLAVRSEAAATPRLDALAERRRRTFLITR
jgi:HK97 family phage prohead protease